MSHTHTIAGYTQREPIAVIFSNSWKGDLGEELSLSETNKLEMLYEVLYGIAFGVRRTNTDLEELFFKLPKINKEVLEYICKECRGPRWSVLCLAEPSQQCLPLVFPDGCAWCWSVAVCLCKMDMRARESEAELAQRKGEVGP